MNLSREFISAYKKKRFKSTYWNIQTQIIHHRLPVSKKLLHHHKIQMHQFCKIPKVCKRLLDFLLRGFFVKLYIFFVYNWKMMGTWKWHVKIFIEISFECMLISHCDSQDWWIFYWKLEPVRPVKKESKIIWNRTDFMSMSVLLQSYVR